MMKKMDNVYRKALGLLTGALMLCAAGCEDNIPMADGSALVLNLTLQDSQIGGPNSSTRANENGLTGENAVSKIDVLAYQESTGALVHHYQLSSVNLGGNTVVDADWESTGYTVGSSYHFYVIANAPAAFDGADLSTEDKLKAFTFTEADAGFFSRGTDFVMDGYKGYTFSGTGDQYLNDVQLARAAAKLELKVQIGPNLKSKMAADELYLHYPSYKASRFARNTSVIADADNYKHDYATSSYTNPFNVAPEQNADAMAAHLVDPDASVKSYEKYIDPATDGLSYTLRAYSYSFSWTAAEALDKAPYMLVSFPIRGKDSTDDNDLSYHYYLVPLVSSSTYSIDRNYLYRATAVIDSYGSAEEVVDDVEVNVNYEVIQWGTNTQTNGVSSNISATDMTFFSVSPEKPAIYEGNVGEYKEVVLHYSASSPVTIVDHPDYAALRTGVSINSVGIAFYNNKNGIDEIFKDAYARLSEDGDDMDNYEVIHDATAHTITVRSMVPTNSSLKKIAFRLTMTDNDGNTYTKDIVVRHFPHDFVSNIPGFWSSRIGSTIDYFYSVDKTATTWYTMDGSSSCTKTWADDDYDGWASTELACTYETYNSYTGNKRYVDDNNKDLSTAEMQAIFGNNNNSAEKCYDNTTFRSDATAKLYNGKHYWVTRSGRGSFLSPYTYTFHERSYYYTVNAYYKEAALHQDWVRWGENLGKRYIADVYFNAKVFLDGRIYWMNKTSSDTNPNEYDFNNAHLERSPKHLGGKAFYITSAPTNNYTVDRNRNNHMYVIQLKSLNEATTIARPTITDHKSNDDVVSPAFMIASQLGTNVTTITSFDVAKLHCVTYLEVGQNGHEYRGWRLPTHDELFIMKQYQDEAPTDGIPIDNVLAAKYYWDLSGDTPEILSTSDRTYKAYVRCIRDLTLNDLRYINGEMTDAEIALYESNAIE